MSSPTPAASRDCEVAIIGSGFAGLCMAIKLKQAGVDDFVVLEKADAVGGVWRDNTYPGCACDVPSHLYSFSFAPKPDWSRMYPTQAELRTYLNHCADEYGIRPHIRFGSEVTSAAFDAAAGRWLIHERGGQVVRARAFVNAAGALSKPALPDVPGLSGFAGTLFHSARWDHDYDLTGKRVAVIGTGASAIQFVPRIAREVQRLHLFQRTAPWIVAKFDPAFRPWQQHLFRKLPLLAWLLRVLIYWLHERAALNFIGKRPTSATEREALAFLERSIPDQELRARVTPDYRVGCKRILLSNDYLPALNRDNVELVTSGIAEVRAHSIVTRDGVERAVDAVILGTGFKATEFVAPLEIRGLGGRELSVEWRDAAPSYLGIVTSGFPNFFFMTGPNTGLGHNSIIFMIEAQVHFIMQCIAQLRGGGVRYLDVRADAQDRFTAEVQARMQHTVWLSGCKSWYLNPDGRNFTLWPGFTFQYWLRTRRLRLSDFERVPGVRDAGSRTGLAAQASAR